MSRENMFTFKAQDGSIWGFAAEVVADDRAQYYAEEDGTTTYADEFKYGLGDIPELRDWLMNNMNYEDFSDYVVKVADAPKPDLRRAWGDVSESESLRLAKVPDGLRLRKPEAPRG